MDMSSKPELIFARVNAVLSTLVPISYTDGRIVPLGSLEGALSEAVQRFLP